MITSNLRAVFIVHLECESRRCYAGRQRKHIPPTHQGRPVPCPLRSVRFGFAPSREPTLNGPVKDTQQTAGHTEFM